MVIDYIKKEFDLIEQATSLIVKNQGLLDDLEDFAKSMADISNQGGNIIFTGIGKNVYICQKLAAMYSSLGIPSFYLDATHALHGDIGILRDTDMLIPISKSGNTEELIKMLAYLKHDRKLYTVGIDCANESEFDMYCDKVLHLNFSKEADDIVELVPTTSAIITLLVGDAIGLEVAKINKFTKEDYHRNHPAGSIGKYLKENQ